MSARPGSSSKMPILMIGACVGIFLMCFLVSLCIGGFYYLTRDKDIDKKDTPSEKTTQEDTTKRSTTVVSTVEEMGTIEGSYNYPSEYIPSNLSACAVSTGDPASEFCATSQITSSKYTYGVGFQIEVPPGTYNVYVEDPNVSGYVGLYSDYVVCGMAVGCDSHEMIDVVVYAGQTKSGINPWDWYSP